MCESCSSSLHQSARSSCPHEDLNLLLLLLVLVLGVLHVVVVVVIVVMEGRVNVIYVCSKLIYIYKHGLSGPLPLMSNQGCTQNRKEVGTTGCR